MQGFDERSNCLIREFGDIPRWVTHTGHKYVAYRLAGDDSNPGSPWFVNFHSNRRSQENCKERADHLRWVGGQGCGSPTSSQGRRAPWPTA